MLFVAAMTNSLVVGLGELRDLVKLVRLDCFDACCLVLLLFRKFDFLGESGATSDV